MPHENGVIPIGFGNLCNVEPVTTVSIEVWNNSLNDVKSIQYQLLLCIENVTNWLHLSDRESRGG